MILKNFIKRHISATTEYDVGIGDIYDDEKFGFMDGTTICTSEIIDEWPDGETGKKYIKTHNSIYEIE